MAVQDDGKVIIGGYFESVNGIPRNNIARINANGSVDETWNPSFPYAFIKVLALVGTNLFVAGSFYSVNGLLRVGLAKLSTSGTGAVDEVWDPALQAPGVEAIAVSERYLYVGGQSLLFAGEQSTNLLRVSITGSGTVDNSWRANTDGGALALALDGTNLYVGGNFTKIGGTTRRGLAKVSTVSGAVDSQWNPTVVDWGG